jgi:hypothetical protein
MVSEGVDIPRLRIAVYATTTTTELFFRQAVGRVVRWTPGVPRQKAWFFVPDDPRLRRYAAEVAEARRHQLHRRRERSVEPSDRPDELALDDDEQLSLFAVIGAVALDTAGTGHDRPAAGAPGGAAGVFADDDEAELVAPGDDSGVELVLLPPPLPGGGHARPDPAAGTGPDGGDDTRSASQVRVALRDANADIAADLVRVTGWSPPAVNKELNRLAGIRKVSEASVEQLRRRLDHAGAWLRRVT